MKNAIGRFYDFFTGTCLTFSKLMILWVIFRLFGLLPVINDKNVLFLLEICAVGWATNFIFHFNASVLVKGVLHSVILFMTGMIIYGSTYNVALEAELLVLIILLYFAIYALFLWIINALSRKLNTPMRHMSDFVLKYKTFLSNKLK